MTMKTTEKKVVYLPLDERPCNYSFVGFLSEENAKRWIGLQNDGASYTIEPY